MVKLILVKYFNNIEDFLLEQKVFLSLIVYVNKYKL